MHYEDARWLTRLFNHTANGCLLNMGKVTISMETARGSTLSANARTPFEIASYLKFFRDTEEPLLKRGTFEFRNQKDLPNPIVFEGIGIFVDPATSLTWHEEQLVRFRFISNENPSEMCLHGDFHREDRINPQNKRTGPSLNEVITLMFSAGHNWSKINFIPQHLKPLALVKT